MPSPIRATRRAPAASQRFLDARRSAPAAWLIGGIGGCFALALAFVLLGGSPPVDILPDRVAALEAKARKAESDGRLPEAIAQFQELLRVTEGREAYRIPAIEWLRVIKDLQAEDVEHRNVDLEFAALRKEATSCGSAEARAVMEKLQRFQVRVLNSKRPWVKELDVLLDLVKGKLPKPPPPWQEVQRRILEERRLEKRGEAQWGGAVGEWKRYLAQELPVEDRSGGQNALRLVEQKAREEVASLKGRNLSAEDLKKQRLRFEGTAAAADLDKAIEGK